MRKASEITGKAGEMSCRPSSTDFTRRRFLFALGATSAGAAAAPALATTPQVVATAADTGKSSGYRETDHVRDYYDSARI